MTTYITSKDYDRLYDLVNSGMRILCFTTHPDYGKQPAQVLYLPEYEALSIGAFSAHHCRIARAREEFIEHCKAAKLEFIDPASQQENHKVIVSYEDLLKEIPGGADILWEERSVVSRTFECSGEAMHEEWRDDEKPVDALFRLYKRVRMEAILDEDD